MPSDDKSPAARKPRIDAELEKQAAQLFQQVTGRKPKGAILDRAELLVVKRILKGFRSQVSN